MNSPFRKAAANNADDVLLDQNEKILKSIHESYHAKAPAKASQSLIASLRPGEEGLLAICEKLGKLPCIAPRRKINVMIVGNHSAGKSSYINWYIGEHVQRTAVAIETQGFTFITSGKKRDTLKGQATVQLFTHLQHELDQFAPAIYNGLQTEISTSKERCFPLITFIDTPGLVDGNCQYLFPVEDALLAVAKHADLIYIFFDPIGQALCERTMKVIERLNLDHAEKLRYFLSKADTVPNERDRQKVVVQITQNLSSRVRNAHAFELPSLYMPDHRYERRRIRMHTPCTCEKNTHAHAMHTYAPLAYRLLSHAHTYTLLSVSFALLCLLRAAARARSRTSSTRPVRRCNRRSTRAYRTISTSSRRTANGSMSASASS